MGKNIAIKVENLSKAYQLGQIGTGTISRDLERFWITKIRGKEDPFLKIGQTNDRTVKGESDIVWSLKDINFEIEQGDAVGIIGRNGAGKSTLLKLLSRVTAPTTGNIKVKGRIASLLEVGTGFHPELTGRENIFLNGAILGMRKKEIIRKFDEIVDFSGVERYIDTPVKRYSSGMYVRLAFAVAAHLESEILIVDEVLAVGDAEFQKKCLGKMGDVSKGEGRTVLFVSHNMASVSYLCSKGIVLNNGSLNYIGTSKDSIDYYHKKNSLSKNVSKIIELTLPTDELKIIKLDLLNISIGSGDDVELKFYFNKFINRINYSQIGLYLIFRDSQNVILFTLSTFFGEVEYFNNESTDCLYLIIPNVPLAAGSYYLSSWLSFNNAYTQSIENLLIFEVLNKPFYNKSTMPDPKKHGSFVLNHNWKI
jgi:lipopolysaccharide transport system ATP-binding protein